MVRPRPSIDGRGRGRRDGRGRGRLDGRRCGCRDRLARWNDCRLYNDGTSDLASVTTNDRDRLPAGTGHDPLKKLPDKK